MTKITYANLYSVSRSNLKTLLLDNVIDPLTRNINNRRPDFIVNLEPDLTKLSPSRFPFIVLPPAENEDEALVMDRSCMIGPLTFDISVYEDYRRGLKDFDTMSDEIRLAVGGSSLKDTRASLGLINSKITGTVFDDPIIAERRLAVRTISIMFTIALST